MLFKFEDQDRGGTEGEQRTEVRLSVYVTYIEPAFFGKDAAQNGKRTHGLWYCSDLYQAK